MRYPGDQDPSSVGLARKRWLIEMAINSLSIPNRKAMRKLLESPEVLRISMIREENKGEYYYTIVILSKVSRLDWPAYYMGAGPREEALVPRYFVKNSRAVIDAEFRTVKKAAAAFLA